MTGTQPLKYNRWLHRFAVLVAALVLFMIVAGGMVTSMDAGDAVPDWPLSYNSVLPPMVGNVFYEHGHRMIGWLLGMMTITLAVWLKFAESRRWVRVLGYVTLVGVCLQGALGGLRVLVVSNPAVQDFLFSEPTGARVATARTIIAIIHTASGQGLLCLVSILALATGRRWIAATRHATSAEMEKHCGACGYDLKGHKGDPIRCPECGHHNTLSEVLRHSDRPQVSTAARSFRGLCLALTIAIFIQLLLGAIRRHTDGTIIFHLLGALAVAGLLIATVRRVFIDYVEIRVLLRPALIMLGALAVQLALGAMSWMLAEAAISRSLPRPRLGESEVLGSAVLTAHVALGALFLAMSVILTARAYRHLTPADGRGETANVPAKGRVATA